MSLHTIFKYKNLYDPRDPLKFTPPRFSIKFANFRGKSDNLNETPEGGETVLWNNDEGELNFATLDTQTAFPGALLLPPSRGREEERPCMGKREVGACLTLSDETRQI